MIWYWLIIAVGVLVLAALVRWHQSLLPLERGLIEVEWEETDELIPEGPDRVELAGEQVIVQCRDSSELNFSAVGTRVTPSALAFVTVHGRRLLVLLDRGKRKWTNLVDVKRAGEKGELVDGLVGWWRHGTGHLVASDGMRLVEVHRCFGRDRIYIIDPAKALQGHAFGVGLEVMMVAPCRQLGRVSLRENEIVVSAGRRAWKAKL